MVELGEEPLSIEVMKEFTIENIGKADLTSIVTLSSESLLVIAPEEVVNALDAVEILRVILKQST